MLKIIILLNIFLTFLYAGESTDDIFKSLQDDLQTYKEIATDTKENVDYMPYVVSVLNNKDLVKLGVVSLREAIVLIPGIDISIGMVGAKNTIFRGSNPFAVGQSKLLIDGTVMNSQMFGAYNQYLDMPIDIIDRIEVVRGPGSMVSGVNAYAGSINVITKANKKHSLKKENSIFTSFGSNNYKMGGYVGGYKKDDFEITSDFFYQEHDQTLPVGVDKFGTNPTDVPLWLKNYSLGLNLNYKNYYVKSRFSNNKRGISYGQSFSISQDERDNLDVSNKSLEAGYKFNVSKGISGVLSLGYSDEYRKIQNKVMPNGATLPGPVVLPNGKHLLADHSAKTIKEQLEFKIDSFDNHSITLGTLFTQSSVGHNELKTSTDNLATLTTSILLSNQKRDVSSFYIDDLININEKTSVQFGLKYDSYSDMKNQLTPRFAIVHRYNDSNIFKLMYTNSYRETSWREKYMNASASPAANLNIVPETVDAYEAAYIYKFNTRDNIKLNIFYLQNKNQINSDNNTSTFNNIADNELYGLEAELKTSITSKDNLYLNYSYVGGKNSNNALANAARNMAKAYYIYDLNKIFSISSILKYIGGKDRVEGDARADVDDFFIADLALTYKYKPSDFLLSFSVKNLFDETYYLPSPKNTYQDDFKQEGRSFYIRLSKRF